MSSDVYQLTILGTCGTEFVENVQHFQDTGVTGAPNPMAKAADLITAWQGSLESDYLDCLPDSTKITGYKCKRVNNGGGPTVMQPISPSTGTRPNPAATSAVGPCIISLFPHGSTWRSGKWFLPGVSTADIIDNVLDPTLVTALNTFIGDLGSSIGGGGSSFDFVVWSRKFSLPFIPAEIEVSLKVGVQRRRLRPVM